MPSIARPLTALFAVALLAGCAELSPEEQIEATRAETTVQLLTFAVKETPVEPAPTADEEGAEDSAEASAEEMAAAAFAEVDTDVILDLLVSSDADQPLPGITVEFEHVDPSETVKDSRRLWVETPNLVRGAGAQVSVVIEDVDYTEGDGFAVTVRSPVPAAERAQYREFQGASGS